MDGASAFNTDTSWGRLLLLDPARGRRILGELWQDDGVVVVELVVLQQGFAKHYGGGGHV